MNIQQKSTAIEYYQQKHAVLSAILTIKLSQKRLQHSMRVADAIYDLAVIGNYNTEQAYLAAMAHDLCKELDLLEIFTLAMQSTDMVIVGEMANIYLQDIDVPSAMLVHGLAATTYLAQHYPLEQEIYLAIAAHTSGHPNPSILQKLLFIADRIETERAIWTEQERAYLFTLTSINRILLTVIDRIFASYGDVHSIVMTMRETILKELRNEE